MRPYIHWLLSVAVGASFAKVKRDGNMCSYKETGKLIIFLNVHVPSPPIFCSCLIAIEYIAFCSELLTVNNIEAEMC